MRRREKKGFEQMERDRERERERRRGREVKIQKEKLGRKCGMVEGERERKR